MFRCIFCFCVILCSLVSLAPAQTQPASQPSTEPAGSKIKLRATAPASDEVDLYWYDLIGGVKRYVIARSSDGGKTWKPVGTEDGTDKPRYDHKDLKVLAQTEYEYRLETADLKTVLSEDADVTTPAKNLLEAAKGESQLNISDVTSVGFWGATLAALWAWTLGIIPRVLVAVFIFVGFYLVHRATRRVASGSLQRANVDRGLHDLLLQLLKAIILGCAIVVACEQIGINVVTLLAGVSLIGLAVGLAAQDTLSNLIASIVIIWDKPFKVGDWVTVNGNYGRIRRVTFRSTRLLTQSGSVMVLPNNAVMGGQILNHSVDPINWVSVPAIIPATVPIEKARQALLATCAKDDRIKTDPPPKVAVTAFTLGDVSLAFSMCISDEAQETAILQEYLEKAKNALDAIK